MCNAIMQGHTCFGCDRLIISDPVRVATNSYVRLYHPECCKCGQCGRNVDGSNQQHVGMGSTLLCRDCSTVRCAYRGCDVNEGVIEDAFV